MESANTKELPIIEMSYIKVYPNSVMAQPTSSTKQQNQPNRRTKISLIFGAIALVLSVCSHAFNVYEFIEARFFTPSQTEMKEHPPRGIL